MNIAKLTALLKLNEAANGPALLLYDDTTAKRVGRLPSGGCATIGYGRNLSDCPISKAEAEMMLQNDIERAIEDCERLFPFFDRLDDVRQAVLVDLVFNVGPSVAQWHHTVGAIERGEWLAAHDNLMSTEPWRSQVKIRAPRLAGMLLSGKWPAGI